MHLCIWSILYPKPFHTLCIQGILFTIISSFCVPQLELIPVLYQFNFIIILHIVAVLLQTHTVCPNLMLSNMVRYLENPVTNIKGEQ